MTWPSALVTEIAERRVVLFLGAGVSKSAVQTLPSWPGLLKEMKCFATLKKDGKLIDKLIRENRLLDAAEVINNLSLPADKNSFLESKFKISPPVYADIYDDILSLDAKVCITTNYDQLIEKNFDYYSGGQKSHQVRTYRYDNLLTDLRSPSRIILKLHGCITEPSRIVLDRKSYFNAKAENPDLYDIVTALSMVNTILFLGYSMNDPDMQLVLESVNSNSKTDHRHFAFVPKFEHPSLRDAQKHAFNIEFIEYPAGQHQTFPKALKELRDAVQSVRVSTGSKA